MNDPFEKHFQLIELATKKRPQLYITESPTKREILPPLINALPKNPLMPQSFNEYVGQERAKDICSIIVDSANLEKRPIPNILLSGSPGLGKTTLAVLIMDRHKQPYRSFDGALAAKMETLNGYMVIDEAHNLTPESADRISLLADNDSIHFIACTTNPGAIAAALRSRCRQIVLEDYTESDLEQILRNAVKRKAIKYSPKALENLAARSRLNPRNALQILAFSLELTSLDKRATLGVEVVKKALDKLDIDEEGLTGQDRKYLSLLSPITPTGLTQICSILGTDVDTVEYDIEPYLLKKRFIIRTPKGRLLAKSISDTDLLERLEHSIEIVKARIPRSELV